MRFHNFENIIAIKSNGIVATPFQPGSNHFLGKTPDQHICLFIKTKKDDSLKKYSSTGKYMNIRYGVSCTIDDISDNKTFNGDYSILEYTGDIENSSFISYLFNIWETLLSILGENPSITELHYEVEKVRLLFAKLTKKPIKTEVGLWGELFCIAHSNDKSFLIKSWHINANDKFDFNDNTNLLEVKTTLKSTREHDFSYDQLNNSRTNDLTIISIMTIETDLGVSVLDLYNIIISELSNSDIIEFSSKLFEISGQELELYDRKFDLLNAQKTIKYFTPNNIPSINNEAIHPFVKNIRFLSNLESTPHIINTSVTNNTLLKKLL